MKTNARKILLYIILALVILWIIGGVLYYFRSQKAPEINGPAANPLSAEDAALLHKTVTASPKALSGEDKASVNDIVTATPKPLTAEESALLKKITAGGQ